MRFWGLAAEKKPQSCLQPLALSSQCPVSLRVKGAKRRSEPLTRSDPKTLVGAVQGETSACTASRLRALFSMAGRHRPRRCGPRQRPARLGGALDLAAAPALTANAAPSTRIEPLRAQPLAHLLDGLQHQPALALAFAAIGQGAALAAADALEHLRQLPRLLELDFEADGEELEGLAQVTLLVFARLLTASPVGWPEGAPRAAGSRLRSTRAPRGLGPYAASTALRWAASGGLGRRIAQLRKARNTTQTQLAEALGVAQQTVQAYAAGARRIPVSTLPLLARTLGVPLEVLFGEEAKAARSRRGPVPQWQQHNRRCGSGCAVRCADQGAQPGHQA